MGVKGGGTGGEKYEAGYHGDVTSRYCSNVRAEVCKSTKRHKERVKVKL